jgi:preprotein translocase subunit SecA
MFAAMMDGIKEESVGFLFNLEVSVEDENDDGVIEGDELEIQEPMRRVIGDFVPDSTDADAVHADDPLVASGPAEQPNEELESPAAAFVRQPASSGPQIRAKGLQQNRQPQNLSYSAPSEGGEAEVHGSSTVTTEDDPFAKVGRNAQCPCGSGKKYKMCHGRPGGPTGLTARAAGG